MIPIDELKQLQSQIALRKQILKWLIKFENAINYPPTKKTSKMIEDAWRHLRELGVNL